MDTNPEKEQPLEVRFVPGTAGDRTENRPVSSSRDTKQSSPRTVDRLVVWSPTKDGEGAPAAPNISTPDELSAMPECWRRQAERADTAPAVERFSVARYSLDEWSRLNYQMISKARDVQRDAILADTESRQCLSSAAKQSDHDQRSSTRLVSARSEDVRGAQSELERAAWLCREEEELLEQQSLRLRRALSALVAPRAVCTECLERRRDRLERDLVQDDLEIQLGKELALIGEVEKVLEETLESAANQLRTSRAARDRLEQDWGGKKEARQRETACLALNMASAESAMLHPACTRIPHGQSTPLSWETSTREKLEVAAQEREASRKMREDIERLLTTAARSLRTQADAVESFLEHRVQEVEGCREALEEQLCQVLARTVEAEKLREELRTAIANHGLPLRVAHTRLATRLERSDVENCRDPPQSGLITEVHRVEDSLSCLRARLTQAETSLEHLARIRSELEHEIRVKRHSLFVDRARCRELRLAFPSTVHLTGY